MRLWWWFRSLYVLCFSVSPVTRERAKWARRRPLSNPGSRPGKSPLRGALSRRRESLYVVYSPEIILSRKAYENYRVMRLALKLGTRIETSVD